MTVTQRAPNEIDYGGPTVATGGGQLFPWRVVCDADDCQYSGVHYTEEQAAWAIKTHPCPYLPQAADRQVKYMSIAERLWVELDRVVDEIMEAPNSPNAESLKGRATGLACALVHMCQPYYPDERSISAEASKRWKIRNKRMDWEPTPGFKYDPPIPGMAPRGTATYNNTSAAPKVDAVAAGVKKLKAGAAEQIRHALSTTPPMFSKEDLARVYGTTVSVIEAVAKDAK